MIASEHGLEVELFPEELVSSDDETVVCGGLTDYIMTWCLNRENPLSRDCNFVPECVSDLASAAADLDIGTTRVRFIAFMDWVNALPKT